MKIATLVCISEYEVDGDVRTFDVSTSEGMTKAIGAWKERILNNYEEDSEHEVLSRIETGIIQEYAYYDGPLSFVLFFGEME